jgi:hypothetical protein
MDQIEHSSARERLAVTSTCPGCGPVDVPVRNVHLWVDGDGLSTYSFICPGCREFVRAPADLGTVGLLLAAAPPLGRDDLHNFRLALEQDDWFHHIERLSRRATSDVPSQPGLKARLARMTTALGSRRHRLLSS